MPFYIVTNPSAGAPWNLLGQPPGVDENRPRALLNLANFTANLTFVAPPAAHGVNQANVPLNLNNHGIYTDNLVEGACAFGILYRVNNQWTRAALASISPQPAANAFNWAALTANMPPGGIRYCVLATPVGGAWAEPIVEQIIDHVELDNGQLWTYDGGGGAGRMSFGLDWNGYAGEPTPRQAP